MTISSMVINILQASDRSCVDKQALRPYVRRLPRGCQPILDVARLSKALAENSRCAIADVEESRSLMHEIKIEKAEQGPP